jgi:glycyl-tRNA synthetase beta chain
MNFLLEIGVEELPAEYARRAWQELVRSKALVEALGGEGGFQLLGADHSLYTPRRLALLATGVPEKRPDQVLEVTGPAKKVAFDAEGRPTRALEGFLKGQGVTLEQLRFVETPKGEYVAVTVTRPGAPVREALQKAIPEALAALPFPKTMRWEPQGARFARPVRWIVALLDGRPLDVRFADVVSGVRSAGHRFFHPGFFELKGLGHAAAGQAMFDGYLGALREHGVMLDGVERRREIRTGLHRLAGASGGTLLEDEDLVEITADLVEWPAVVCGAFDASYLDLPREVIVTAMREHQRYFAALGPDGRLRPNFLCVANASQAYLEELRGAGAAGLARGLQRVMESSEPGGAADPRFGGGLRREELLATLDEVLEPIARGNERVLKARLDDARFYWDTDLARWRKTADLPPEQQAEPLKGVVWLENWGTVHEKAGRVSRLAGALGPEFGLSEADVAHLRRAAWLMKLDLTAEMIKDGKEFTSLEGRMGALYAGRCGEPAEVTGPMAEHYLPRESVTEEADRQALVHGRAASGAEGAAVRAKLPATREARVLALLDKLDSVAGFFAAGRIPRGSEDPFGVRRAGNGLVALLLFDQWVLRRAHVEAALRGYAERVADDAIPGLCVQVFDFLVTRLRAFLADLATEAVHAALGAGQLLEREVFEPLDAAARAGVMHGLLGGGGADAQVRAELFGLSTLFKRVSNILKECSLDEIEVVPAELEPGERKLFEALEAVSPRVLECYRGRRYDAALGELLRLRAPIDQFFLDVLVMAEDPVARGRRLKLLRRTQRLLLGGWDFTQVSVPASTS